MRILDYESNKAINDVAIFLSREEAEELVGYLSKLVASPDLNRVHLCDIVGNRLEREITVALDGRETAVA